MYYIFYTRLITEPTVGTFNYGCNNINKTKIIFYKPIVIRTWDFKYKETNSIHPKNMSQNIYIFYFFYWKNIGHTSYVTNEFNTLYLCYAR